MTDDIISKCNAIIDFSALKLRAGTWLKLHRLLGEGPTYEVEFVAAIHGTSIFVTQPDTRPDSLQIGDQYVIHGFNGTSEFIFTSEVFHVQAGPFFYLHLTYPDSVEVRVVRDALRVKVSIPVITLPDNSINAVPGTMKDLSIKGAMVESMAHIGQVGDKINIAFSTQIEAREKVDLKIPAAIIHVTKHDTEGVFRNGLEFGDIARNDKMILYYLLFTHYVKITNEINLAIMQLKNHSMT